jgi:hypothetical protein
VIAVYNNGSGIFSRRSGAVSAKEELFLMKKVEEMYVRMLESTTLLMKNSEEAQTRLFTSRGFVSDVAWAKEFCTVRVGGPRQSGHSTLVNHLVDKFDGKAIVFGKTMSMLKRINCNHKFSNACKFSESIRGLCGDANPRAVIVDAASLLSQHNIDDIYRVCAPIVRSFPFYFIFIG